LFFGRECDPSGNKGEREAGHQAHHGGNAKRNWKAESYKWMSPKQPEEKWTVPTLATM
jgi:hypothetical protein